MAEDREEALALFRRAAEQGHAKSINMVGSFYEDGWVVERDPALAAEQYRRAAEGGDFRGMFNHARMLIEQGTPDQATAWLTQLPEAATPAFLEKARQWLEGRPEEGLRDLAASWGAPQAGD